MFSFLFLLTGWASRRGGLRIEYDVRPSLVSGHGLFTTQYVPRGTMVWRYEPGVNTVAHNESSLRAQLKRLRRRDAARLLRYSYALGGTVFTPLDDSRMCNHAPAPNCGDNPNGPEDMNVYALRHLRPNEELFEDYGDYENLPWFDALCSEHRLRNAPRWLHNRTNGPGACGGFPP